MLSRVGRRMTEVFQKMTTSEEAPPPPPMEIGTPYNFQHIQHAKADPHTSTGFSVSITISLSVLWIVVVIGEIFRSPLFRLMFIRL